MRISKVISSYKHLSDDQLVVLSGKIARAMIDNPYFEEPNPTLEELTSLAEDYREKQQVSVNGGSSLDNRLKNSSRKQLLKGLRTLAYYVNTVADGDLPALTSTGMILEKTQSSIGTPAIIENVTLKDGNLSGQVRVDFDAQKIAREYEIQLGQWDPDTNAVKWRENLYTTTKPKGNILAPVTPAERYFVRVRGRNGKGSGDWTESVSIIAR